MYSITPNHFIHAGPAGHEHFHHLLRLLISDVNLSSTREVNSVFAKLLYKGHNKDKTSDRSWRTISNCPVLAKALDTHIGDLYGAGWLESQAETQFQGAGRSHTLAALLLTETILISTQHHKQPLYSLFLDAKSCFDKILYQSVVKEAFLAGTQDQGLILIKNRLENRQTFCEYNKTMMGPIQDKLGVEQGGKNSDRYFRLCGNNQLKSAQRSGLGSSLLEGLHVAAIGQADDTCIVSSSIHKLRSLVNLTKRYCEKFHVELVPEKTRLLSFCPRTQKSTDYYNKSIANIQINGEQIKFSDEAEHVGIVRSTHSNMPHLLSRFTSHRRAVNACLPAGMARGHRGNPAAALRLEAIYGAPVLFSGVSSLLLTTAETSALTTHHKEFIQSLVKLYQRTPDCVVYLLAGCLPALAQLHLAQFSLLAMLAQDQENIITRHAISVLTSTTTVKSWFTNLQATCTTYSLPSALTLLTSNLSKEQIKTTIWKKVVRYWELKLCDDARGLDSLIYFKPSFYSLTKPHPVFTSAGSSPYEVEKSKVQARMLSGRYRTERLRRHWSQNRDGFCLLPTCWKTSEDLEHILVRCPAHREARTRVLALWADYLATRPHLATVVHHYTSTPGTHLVQFLVDPSVLPLVITLGQEHGEGAVNALFYLTRTFCYSIHRCRLKLLGLI